MVFRKKHSRSVIHILTVLILLAVHKSPSLLELALRVLTVVIFFAVHKSPSLPELAQESYITVIIVLAVHKSLSLSIC